MIVLCDLVVAYSCDEGSLQLDIDGWQEVLTRGICNDRQSVSSDECPRVKTKVLWLKRSTEIKLQNCSLSSCILKHVL